MAQFGTVTPAGRQDSDTDHIRIIALLGPGRELEARDPCRRARSWPPWPGRAANNHYGAAARAAPRHGQPTLEHRDSESGRRDSVLTQESLMIMIGCRCCPTVTVARTVGPGPGPARARRPGVQLQSGIAAGGHRECHSASVPGSGTGRPRLES